MKNSKCDLLIDFCSYKALKFACKNWHYSKSIPPPPHIKFGVWENKKFIGIILFSYGVNKNTLKQYNLKQNEVFEIVRIALNKHITPVSRILSITLKLFQKSNPFVKLITSYADSNEGHLGIIYQASNFIFDGTSSKSYTYFDKNNKKIHSREISERGYCKQFGKYTKCLKPSNLRRVLNKEKYRYLFPLNQDLRKVFLKKAKPFPKNINASVV